MVKTNLVRNFIIQRMLLGNLNTQDSMLDSIEFIKSQIIDNSDKDYVNNLINTIDYRLKEEEHE
jgi:hypothetical protein